MDANAKTNSRAITRANTEAKPNDEVSQFTIFLNKDNSNINPKAFTKRSIVPFLPVHCPKTSAMLFGIQRDAPHAE